MSSRREVLTGIIAALISIVIIGGSLAIATAEEKSIVAINMTNTPTLTSFPTHIILVTQRPGEPTFTASPTVILPSQTPSPTISCPPPAGWSSIILQPGDTLENLALTYNTTPEELKKANCMLGDSLAPGTLFSVPGAPPPTDIPCGPPPGWKYYIVQPGDTLYSIGNAYGVTVSQLQAANCLGSSTTIRVGQKLHVPNVKPVPPSSTPRLTETSPPEKSATPTVIIPSATPSMIPPTHTPTEIPASATPIPIPPTNTPLVPSVTPTQTDTPIPPTPTLTYTPSPEPTTLVPTDLPTSTTPSTSTPYPTSTQTFTPEPPPSLTPTSTP